LDILKAILLPILAPIKAYRNWTSREIMTFGSKTVYIS